MQEGLNMNVNFNQFKVSPGWLKGKEAGTTVLYQTPQFDEIVTYFKVV